MTIASAMCHRPMFRSVARRKQAKTTGATISRANSLSSGNRVTTGKNEPVQISAPPSTENHAVRVSPNRVLANSSAPENAIGTSNSGARRLIKPDRVYSCGSRPDRHGEEPRVEAETRQYEFA